jgi:hypothetical protein
LDAINKIYKIGNEVKHFEDIHKIIENAIKKDAAILAYAHILNIRSKYPRLFLLVTVKNIIQKLKIIVKFRIYWTKIHGND